MVEEIDLSTLFDAAEIKATLYKISVFPLTLLVIVTTVLMLPRSLW